METIRFTNSEPQVDKDVETYGSFCVTRLGQAVKASEAEAGHLGFSVERTKNVLIVIAAAGVGACVAFTGIIGFVGLVVPHLVRLWIGPDHRWLLPGSALLGAIILTLADTIARTIVAPAELPIGALTAAFGGPSFLFMLLRQRHKALWS